MEKEEQNPKTSVVLPKELEEEILQYLPVKSLIRFKSVSKQWRSMIESNYFIKKHRVCSFSNPKVVVVGPKKRYHQESFHLKTYSRDHQDEYEVQMSLSSYNSLPAPSIIVGSCDGLVCLTNLRFCVCIINPVTRKQRKLYSSRIQRGPGHMGFGKDMVTGRYKTIVLYESEHDGRSLLLKTMVLSKDYSKQRDIGDFPVSKYEISNNQASNFANGSVFWLTQPNTSKTPIKLVALDLHTEKFRRVSWPSWYVEHSFGMRIWNLKNRLCLSNVLQYYPILDVWSLKTIEDSSEQWEKIFAINVSSMDRLDTKFWMLYFEAAYFRPKEERDSDPIPLCRQRTTLFRETLVSP